MSDNVGYTLLNLDDISYIIAGSSTNTGIYQEILSVSLSSSSNLIQMPFLS